MTKKGFTLIELLGAITIMAIISLLAFPPIIDQINKSKNNLSETMKKVIFSATDLYLEANSKEYVKKDGNIYCITLQQLVDTNFLKEPVVDATSGNNISLSKMLEVKVVNSNFYVDVNDKCTGYVVSKTTP